MKDFRLPKDKQKIFKCFENESEQFSKKERIKVLFVGTAENRLPIITEEPGMPNLVDEYDNIVDPFYEKSNLETGRSNIFNDIQNILGHIPIIDYMSIDPLYSQYKRTVDNPNYMGHVTLLLENFETDIKFDIISIVGCYNDLFSITNIDKIKELMNKDGHLLIQDTVPYNFSGYFKKTFLEIKC